MKVVFLVLLAAAVVYAAPHDLYGVYPSNNGGNANLNVFPPSGLTGKDLSALTLKWATPEIFDDQYTSGHRLSVQSTAVVAYDGNVYFANARGDLFSYTYDGVLNWVINLKDANGAPDYFDESPAITESRVFIGGSRCHCVDRLTGVEVWATNFDDDVQLFPSGGDLQPSQLMLAENLVIYGLTYADEVFDDNLVIYDKIRGKLCAFDQDTGARVWLTDLTKIGGVYGPGLGTYAGGAVDTTRHLFFIGIGNEYRPPVSPISDSLIAIDYRDGSFQWHYQYYPGDLCGVNEQGNFDCTIDGKHDFDVSCHPQLFQVYDPSIRYPHARVLVDVVGCKSKDGTYRIFRRDQTPDVNTSSTVTPLAQLQLDPGAGWNPTFGAEPIVKDRILYAVTQSWIADMWDGTSIDTSVDVLKAAHVSTDLMPGLNNFYESSTFRAVDLQKLVDYYHDEGATKPICAGKLQYRLCAGRVPSDSGIFLWQQVVRQSAVLSSSGLSYIDGYIVYGDLNGRLRFLRASDGVQTGPALSVLNSVWSVPDWDFYGLPILGGVSAFNGTIFVPTGYDFQGFVSPGGLAAFGFP